jgi:RNA polymerase sigma factor (sigma-70 family)
MPASDTQLLETFARRREESAFEAIVERHGPVVLGVCRRVLHDEHDAEDAFQATFLVLARNAASIRNQEALGAWLYGVAYRVAHKLKQQAGQRRAREHQMAAELGDLGGERLVGDLVGSVVWRELRPVIDEELSRLPEKYRAPLVLCYLEGKTHEEAARALGWSKGSMSRRMDKARELLRSRLCQRGITLSAGILFAAFSHNAASAAVPASLVQTTVRAAASIAAGRTLAAGLISAQAAAVTQGVLHTMFMTKVKLAGAACAFVALLGVSAGVATYGALADDTQGEAGKRPAASGDAKSKAGQSGGDPSRGPTAAGGDAGTKSAPESTMTARQVRELLAQPSTKLAQGIDPGTPFKDAIDILSQVFEVPIHVDYNAFQTVAALTDDQLDQMQVRLPPLRKNEKVTPGRALRNLLRQIGTADGGGAQGTATFVVKDGAVVIVPSQRVVPDDAEIYPNGTPVSRALREPVTVSVEDRPLRQALRELADASGANIVVDMRLKEKLETPVTAILQHVPLETAVRLLADMAEVRAVAVDNVLYVTTQDNAGKFEREQYNRVNGMYPDGTGLTGSLGGGLGGFPGAGGGGLGGFGGGPPIGPGPAGTPPADTPPPAKKP